MQKRDEKNPMFRFVKQFDENLKYCNTQHKNKKKKMKFKRKRKLKLTKKKKRNICIAIEYALAQDSVKQRTQKKINVLYAFIPPPPTTTTKPLICS